MHLLELVTNSGGLQPVQLREQQTLHHMYDIFSLYAPQYLCSQITVVHTQHNYKPRASVRSCKVPLINNVDRSCFFYTGAMLWNRLPLLFIMKQAYRSQVMTYLWNRVTDLSLNLQLHFYLSYQIVLVFCCGHYNFLFKLW